MKDTIIEQERLMQITGAKQKAALRRYLRKAGIPFKEPNGRIFTTQGAIDAVLVGRGKKTKTTEPNWDGI